MMVAPNSSNLSCRRLTRSGDDSKDLERTSVVSFSVDFLSTVSLLAVL